VQQRKRELVVKGNRRRVTSEEVKDEKLKEPLKSVAGLFFRISETKLKKLDLAERRKKKRKFRKIEARRF
jgi:hypothetical protein